MSIKFVVREVEFAWDDERYMGSDDLGSVYKTYDSLEEAEDAVKRLTVEWLRNESSLSHYELFDEWTSEINDLCLERCGVVFSDDDTPPDELPAELTDKDVADIAALTELEVYKVVQFDSDNGFYTVFIIKDQTLFKNSYATSVNNLIDGASESEELFWLIANAFSELSGSLEDLSNSPELLKSFIEQNPSGIKYDNETLTVDIWQAEDDPSLYFQLNELLKNPIFEIRKLNFEDVINV
jgi:hypothetical protein